MVDHEHCHEHEHEHGHSHHHHVSVADVGANALWKAVVVTAVFMVVELIGGLLANSLALISDAAHMLTDIGAMLLSLFVFWISKRPYTSKMSFGYHRAEILGALGSGLSIWLIAGILIYQAILRLMAPPEVKGPMVFVVAVIGLAANLISMRLLFSAKQHSLNVKAAYLHVLFDSLGSVAAIVTGVVLWTTDWRVIDPIVTIVLALLMLFSSWDLIKESVAILMESVPSGIDPVEVRKALGSIEGVEEVHDLHIWTVSNKRIALSVHLISRRSEQDILKLANEMLTTKYEVNHTTIQVENPEKFQSKRCYDCMND